MRLSYPHKDIRSEGHWFRHRWCGLGFCYGNHVNLFQGISHPHIRLYGTSVVGWLCLDHRSGGTDSSIQFIYHVFTYFGLLISNRFLAEIDYLYIS